MDLQPAQVPAPGKPQPLREKAGRKTKGPSKTVAGDPPVPRQKRVFGTLRSTNVPAKPHTEKPAAKSVTGVRRKQAQSPPKSPSTVGATLASAAVKTSPEGAKPKPEKKSVYFEEESPKNLDDAPAEKTSAEISNPKPKKKGVCFEEESPENLDDAPAEKASPEIAKPKPKKKSVCFEEKSPNNLRDENAVGPQTPVQWPFAAVAKPRRSGTPYHTAENCSKCRFDRLETASYWLGHIKLAEPVGKHFVSANFFRMALECKAEPIRNLRIELKRYLARHLHLSEEAEWRNLSLGYGILKDEPDSGPRNPGSGRVRVRLSAESNRDGQEQQDTKDELIDSKGE
ncbi:nucleolar protein dao-5-like isoform X2 [Rhodamnia argentea]|uniref:Nucleolar protein dao-5-like isoform X2 n=1 Tax=Rhodamnia argentea TaxID=178133 RepID=A0A8B8NW87_9MYRT|nr:nucleolar protein dao-5-like isoform X2 [Rhodamnia argentea]